MDLNDDYLADDHLMEVYKTMALQPATQLEAYDLRCLALATIMFVHRMRKNIEWLSKLYPEDSALVEHYLCKMEEVMKRLDTSANWAKPEIVP